MYIGVVRTLTVSVLEQNEYNISILEKCQVKVAKCNCRISRLVYLEKMGL